MTQFLSAMALSNESVAYLFLLRGRVDNFSDHPLSEAWNRYFDGCDPGSFMIGIHLDGSGTDTRGMPSSMLAVQPPREPPMRQGHFGARAVLNSSLQVKRFAFSIVKAKLKLLRNARDRAREARVPAGPAWSLLFSDSCAPLLSCQAVHKYLREHSGRSFTAMSRTCEQGRLHDTKLKLHDCRASLGWIGLYREASQHILDREERNAPFFVRTGIPDEFYWSTILNLEGLPSWNRHLTYMHFTLNSGGHPDTITDGTLPHIRALAIAKGYAFARKFAHTREVNVALAQSYASASQWPMPDESSVKPSDRFEITPWSKD